MDDFRRALVASCVVEAYAVNAQIEAMKAVNAHRERRGEVQAYGGSAFAEKADDLAHISERIVEVARD